MNQLPTVSRFILPVIVFAQFAGTSLWFAANAILPEVTTSKSSFANIYSIVQLGFIAGTFIFSITSVADRYSPKLVFFISSLCAALANVMLCWNGENISWLLLLRFITGFFLAGIYPVGMKMAADCFPKKLGSALGYLVGALVLGTAFPYAFQTELQSFQWQEVLVYISIVAVTGGLMILLVVPSYTSAESSNFSFRQHSIISIFKSRNFRASAFGYFGHMWELYAFWAFVPIILQWYNVQNAVRLDIPMWSFLIIAAGCAGCITGGFLSRWLGSKSVAMYSLILSGGCCVALPFLFSAPVMIFLFVMMAWGFFVVSDSPQFSTMVAKSVRENKGTALTLVTCIGFAITIVSIQLLRYTLDKFGEYGLFALLPGTLLGVASLKNYLPDKQAGN